MRARPRNLSRRSTAHPQAPSWLWNQNGIIAPMLLMISNLRTQDFAVDHKPKLNVSRVHTLHSTDVHDALEARLAVSVLRARPAPRHRTSWIAQAQPRVTATHELDTTVHISHTRLPTTLCNCTPDWSRVTLDSHEHLGQTART
jgi:hypothetical protein